jgi:hypothetical protein
MSVRKREWITKKGEPRERRPDFIQGSGRARAGPPGQAMKHMRRKHKARRKAAAYRKPNKTSTAYHEAGHAVIGRVLTLACGHATIKPDYSTATAGVSICLPLCMYV